MNGVLHLPSSLPQPVMITLSRSTERMMMTGVSLCVCVGRGGRHAHATRSTERMMMTGVCGEGGGACACCREVMMTGVSLCVWGGGACVHVLVRAHAVT